MSVWGGEFRDARVEVPSNREPGTGGVRRNAHGLPLHHTQEDPPERVVGRDQDPHDYPDMDYLFTELQDTEIPRVDPVRGLQSPRQILGKPAVAGFARYASPNRVIESSWRMLSRWRSRNELPSKRPKRAHVVVAQSPPWRRAFAEVALGYCLLAGIFSARARAGWLTRDESPLLCLQRPLWFSGVRSRKSLRAHGGRS